MSDDNITKLITGLITAILGGVVVAAFNFFVGRRKLDAEIAQIKANTQKTILETESLTRSVRDVSERISQSERTVYDGTKEMNGFHFKGQGERFYGDDASKPLGAGSLTVGDNQIKIVRENTGGRYRVILMKYLYNEIEFDHLPKNSAIEGDRKIRVSCEARVSAGTHKLGFSVKGYEDDHMYHRTDFDVVGKEWRSVEKHIRIDSTANVRLWLEDQEVSSSDSIITIRRLVLVEA